MEIATGTPLMIFLAAPSRNLTGASSNILLQELGIPPEVTSGIRNSFGDLSRRSFQLSSRRSFGDPYKTS